MKLESREWVAKAEGDYHDAQRGIRARKHPNPDGVCFHAQQCVEKYLKACLIESGIAFPRTHNLPVLLDLALPVHPMWDTWRADLNLLTEFAVEYRYPGESAKKEDAKNAWHICRGFRSTVREKLGLRAAAD